MQQSQVAEEAGGGGGGRAASGAARGSPDFLASFKIHSNVELCRISAA